MQLFKLHPLDFIVKPINYQKIENVMNEYNRLFKFKNSYFEYSMSNGDYIPISRSKKGELSAKIMDMEI